MEGDDAAASGTSEEDQVNEALADLAMRSVNGKSRFASDFKSLNAHISKVHIIQGLFRIADLRAHYRVGQLLHAMKEYADRGETILTRDGFISEAFFAEFEKLFTSADGTALDINAMMDAPIDSVCLDLIMYDTDEVFESALGFMRRRYGQRRALLNVLPKLSILHSESLPIFGTFSALTSSLKDLTYIVRSYDTWGVYNSPSRPLKRETYEKAIKIFDRLDQFLFNDDTSTHYDPHALPSRVRGNVSVFHQRILRNVGLVRSVLVFSLDIDYDLMKKVDPDFAGLREDEVQRLYDESREMLYTICKRVVFTLNAFVMNDAQNQKILFNYLSLLREKMGVGLNVWDIIISLFEANQDLCEIVPRGLFMEIAKIMQKMDIQDRALCSNATRLLDFFYTLMKPSELRPIARNQDMSTLVLFDRSVSSNLVLEVNLLSNPDVALVIYHVKLVKLLALSAQEKNSTSTARIQGKVSFEAAIDKVSQDVNQDFMQDRAPFDIVAHDTLVQAAFLDLLTTVYIDTALLERGLSSRRPVWIALAHITKKVRGLLRKKLVKETDTRPSECSDPSPETAVVVYFISAVNFIAKFFKICYETNAVGEDCKELHNTVMCEVRSLLDDNGSYVFSDELSSAFSALGMQVAYKLKAEDFRQSRKASLVEPGYQNQKKKREEHVSFEDNSAVPATGPTLQTRMDLHEDKGLATFASNAFAAKISAKFDMIDEDGNGYLSHQEVKAAMKKESPKLTDKDVKTLFKKYDKVPGAGIDKNEFSAMMADAASMEPNSGLDWLKDKEVLDDDPALMNMMKTNPDDFFLTKLVPAMFKSDKLQEALNKKDNEFLDVLENCESQTSPANPEYIAALKGTSIRDEKRLELERLAHLDADNLNLACQKVLSTLNGQAALVAVLAVVFLAVIILIVQLIVGQSEALKVVDRVVTGFFFAELFVKAACHFYIHKELDSFLMDLLNFIDVIVVIIDLVFIYVEARAGTGGSRSGGLIKALRLARSARLFRLLRLRKLLAVEAKPLSREEALKDPRSVPIKFDSLLDRMVRYLKANSLRADKTETLLTVMQVLKLHMQRVGRLMEPKSLEDGALIEDCSVSEMLERRTQEFMEIQKHVGVDCGCAFVLLNAISKCENGVVREDAVDTLRQLLEGGNEEIQKTCLETLSDTGNGAIGPMFFFAIRDNLREAASKLKEYRRVRKANFSRAASLLSGVKGCTGIVNLLKEMCEGHYRPLQDIFRKQPHARNTNIVEEVAELWTVVAKSLPCVRRWDEAEGQFANELMRLMVEMCQGPCPDNQHIFASNGKCIDGCLCVITANLRGIKDAKLVMQLGSTCMLLLSSILENGTRETIQYVFDLVPVTILDERANKVAKKLEWLDHMGSAFKHEFLDLLNTEAQSILSVKTAFEEILEERELEFENDAATIEGMADHMDGSTAGNDDDKAADEEGLKQPDLEMLNLRNVEVFWHGKCQKVFFNPKLTSLSSASKKRFLDDCDLGSQESRVKAMINACEDLNDEMVYQDTLKEFVIFQWFSKNFLSIKAFVFALVLLLNVNVMLSTLTDSNLVLAESSWGLDTSEGLTVFLGLAVNLFYTIIVAFLIVSFGPLEWRRCLRNQVLQDEEEEAVRQRGEEVQKSHAMLKYFVALLFYVLCCYIHSLTKGAYTTERYQGFGEVLFLILLPFALRQQLQLPKSPILRRYCAALDSLNFPPIKNHIILVIFTYIGLWRSYFFTLTLLDVLTMSMTLYSVVKSVVIPISQLTQTFFLFIVVICCYTSFAYFLFGSNQFGAEDDRMIEYVVTPANGTVDEKLEPTGKIWLPEEEDGAVEGCDTLLECFIQTTYIGIRAGDMAEVLDDPDEGNYHVRMIFDLSFFLILGILLFDMVTGIILDTFGALREEVAEREAILKNESFVSGLERKEIEEAGGLNFDSINDSDQDVWDYIFFVIHLKSKNVSEMTGCESYVHECLENQDTKWIPNRTCVALERLGLADEDNNDEALLLQKMEKLEQSMKKLEEIFIQRKEI